MARGRMKPDRKRRKKNEAAVDAERSSVRLEEQRSTELLPGIPDDVTLQVISTMLTWETFHTLSSVSRAWQQAVQSREVYDARVRCHSTEMLVVINHTLPRFISRAANAISLYCLRDKAFYQLPPIPHVRSGIPRNCQFITLDGKIYILGGLQARPESYARLQLGRDEVYVLDLAGQRPWKRCASMLAPRQRFGCGVIDGKIYVCGGTSLGAPVRGTEVYDPKTDAWSLLTPMTSCRVSHQVETVGGELLVYGGRFSNDVNTRTMDLDSTFLAFDLEVYNPVKDLWRKLSGIPWGHDVSIENFFMAESKLYSMTRKGISAFDIEKNPRTRLNSYSRTYSRTIERLDPPVPHFEPEAALAVDDEVLAMLSWYDHPLRRNGRRGQVHVRGLLQSKGLGIRDDEMVWESILCFLSFKGLPPPFMRPLQL